MYSTDRRSQEFIDGVHSLLRVAEANKRDVSCAAHVPYIRILWNMLAKDSSFTLVQVRFHAKLYLLDEAWRNRGCNERR